MDGDESEQNSTSVEPQESPPSLLNLIPQQLQQPQKYEQESEEPQDTQEIVVQPQTQTSEVNNTVSIQQTAEIEQSVEPQITVQSTLPLHTQVQMPQQQIKTETVIQMPQQENPQQQIIQSQQQIDLIQQQIETLQQHIDTPQQNQIMQIIPQQQVQIHQQQIEIPQQQIQNSQQEIQISQNQVESEKNNDSLVDGTEAFDSIGKCLKYIIICTPMTIEVVLGIISILVGLGILGIFGMIIYAFVLMVQCPYSAVMPIYIDDLGGGWVTNGNWEAHCDLVDPSSTQTGQVHEGTFNVFWLACLLLLGGAIGFVVSVIAAVLLAVLTYAVQSCNCLGLVLSNEQRKRNASKFDKSNDDAFFGVGIANLCGSICTISNTILNVGNAFCSIVGAVCCCLCCPIFCCVTCCAFCTGRTG